MRSLIAMLLAAVAVSVDARADLWINEVLGSTASTDKEYIEIYNDGPLDVDLIGYRIELWDSDSGATFGLLDATAPYMLTGTISAGGYYVIANPLAESTFGFTADLSFPADSIENSSYTILLKDPSSAIVDGVFVTDGDAGDAANDGGMLLPMSFPKFGPELPPPLFMPTLPAGFYRTTDGGSVLALQSFADPTSAGTPGFTNSTGVPEPSAMVLAGLVAIGLRVRRRFRAA